MGLVNVPVTEEQLAYRNRLIDGVLACPPGPPRWRAAAAMMLTLNPLDPETGRSLRYVNQQCIAANRVAREGLLNKFGTSGTNDANLRSFLSMPAAIKLAIERTEPMAFKEKKNAGLMFKAFPEYRTAEAW